jgi:hypothetical protein
MSLLPRTFHMLCQSHCLYLHKPNNNLWHLKIMTLHPMQLSLDFCCFLPLRPKYLSQDPFLHILRSRASSFGWEYPLLSLLSSSSFLRLLPRLPVTSIPPFIFPSITCRRMQFLRNMWPIQIAFRLRISCRIFLCSLILLHFSHDRPKPSAYGDDEGKVHHRTGHESPEGE